MTDDTLDQLIREARIMLRIIDNLDEDDKQAEVLCKLITRLRIALKL